MSENLFTVAAIVVTVVMYIISRRICLMMKNTFLTPLLISTAVIIAMLQYAGISFEAYKPAKNIMTFLLGPATVALALPLYLKRQVLKEALLPIVAGIAGGAVATVTVSMLLAKFSGLDNMLIISLAPKSITAPIAIDIALITGGDPAIAVAFVVFTGTFGSMIGAAFLTLCKVNDPVARGLAMGVTAHGQGTATILQEGQTQGAMAGVAMALAAILVSFIAPFYIPWLL